MPSSPEIIFIGAVGKWSFDNFGEQSPTNPLLGSFEELLYELPRCDTPEEAKDAFADGFIYQCDFAYRNTFLTEIAERINDKNYWNKYVFGGIEFSDLEGPHEILGKMANVQLKHAQKIKKWADPAVYRSDMADLWMCLYFWLDGMCQNYWSEGILQVAQEVFDKVVAKRNWKSNPVSGVPEVIELPAPESVELPVADDRTYVSARCSVNGEFVPGILETQAACAT